MNRTIFAAMIGAPVAMLFSPALAGETFNIDGGHTHVLFKVERFGLSYTIASFADVSGVLVLDEDHPEKSSVEASVGIASIRSDNPAREEVVRGPHWLDAEAFPTATFKSTKVTLTGEHEADVLGDLTVHGVTKPVTLKVQLHNIGTDPVSKHKAAGFSARTMVDRNDFGVSTAKSLIGNEVDIFIEALAIAGE